MNVIGSPAFGFLDKTETYKGGKRRRASLPQKLILSVMPVMIAALSAQTASAQVPQNPTNNCTWNWNYWSIPGGYTGQEQDQVNPAKYIFSKASTALGTDAWYDVPLAL